MLCPGKVCCVPDPQQHLAGPFPTAAVLSCSPVRKQPPSSRDFQPVVYSLNSCFSQSEESPES